MIKIFTSLLFILMISLSNSVSAKEEYWEYTFRPNDSLWKIANQYTTSANNWKAIQKLNQIHQGVNRKIPIGSRIIIPISMLKVKPVPARIIAVSGEIILLRANGDKSEIKVGTLLYSGDRVVTGDHQILHIQFADQSQLQILPNSEVVIDKLSRHQKSGMFDTQIRLNNGRINTQVEKQKKGSRYEIITPSAITAVRGTSFRKSFNNNSSISRTEVLEGAVNVYSKDSEKLVKEGYGIIVEKDKPLSDPIKLLGPPILSINQPDNQIEIQISWNKLKSAHYYRYQLSNDDKFNQLIVDSTTQDNEIKLNNLQPGHFYIRVLGVDQYELEGLNSIQNFIINEPKKTKNLLENIVLPTEIFLLNL